MAVRTGSYLLVGRPGGGGGGGGRGVAVRWCCYLLGGGRVCGFEMGLPPAGNGKSVWL